MVQRLMKHKDNATLIYFSTLYFTVLYCTLLYFTILYYTILGPWWRSWLRHCGTSQKVAGSIPDGVIGRIFH